METVSPILVDPDEDYPAYDDEDMDVCDGCGMPYGEGQCPLCCGFVFSPGSDGCDFCEYHAECM